jgi:hypothetical protein
MLADDELASSDATKAFERVHLHVSNTLLGGVLSGFLDPQGSVLLTTALDLLEPPDPVGGADVPRTLSQRRGEALVKLAQHYLDTRGHSPGARGPHSRGDRHGELLSRGRCPLFGRRSLRAGRLRARPARRGAATRV